MPKLYICSKAKWFPFWQMLRGAGIATTCQWIDWPPNSDGTEPTPSQWERHWAQIVADVRQADICLFVSLENETACSGLIELGIALAEGKQCWIVSPDWWSVSHHPSCVVLPSLEAAARKLVAMAAGEAARESMERGRRLTIA